MLSDLLAPGLDEALASMRIDCCVHLAGAPSGCKMAKGQVPRPPPAHFLLPPSDYFTSSFLPLVPFPPSSSRKLSLLWQEHNLIGTRRLMDALLPTGCRRFIIASSIGSPNPNPITPTL